MNATDHTLPSTEPDAEERSGKGGQPVGLISNPNSGRNRKQLLAIERIVANHPRIHHYPTSDATDVPAALTALAQQGVGAIAINGGDGTVAHVLSHLLEDSPFQCPPLIVLLPGGTTNMSAGDVGQRGNLVNAVQRLCRWADDELANARLLRRPILRIEPGSGQSAVYGMFFGAGAIVEGIEYCRARIHTRGIVDEIAAGLAMARTMWGIARGDRRFTRPVSVSVAYDGAPPEPEQDILILLTSTLERLFLGMRPYWGTEDAPLHVSLVRAGAHGLLRSLPALLRGRPARRAGATGDYQSRNLTCLDLLLDGPWTLDGEMYRASRAAGPVRIRTAGPVTFVRL